MRVVSLVPSWTETLIDWGVDVVGRTRYCIHPAKRVLDIPIIGGTKDTRWERLHKLKPDLIIVDREENRRSVLEKAKVPLLISHIEKIQDMPSELQKIIDTFSHYGVEFQVLQKVYKDKQRWESVLKSSKQITQVPAVIRWINKPQENIKNVEYIIWKDPWMKVSINTFIGSVLSHIGFDVESYETKYPEFDLLRTNTRDKLFLFSSEPYDFNQDSEVKVIKELGLPAAIVDGESYSWFGSRTLSFLESL